VRVAIDKYKYALESWSTESLYLSLQRLHFCVWFPFPLVFCVLHIDPETPATQRYKGWLFDFGFPEKIFKNLKSLIYAKPIFIRPKAYN